MGLNVILCMILLFFNNNKKLDYFWIIFYFNYEILFFHNFPNWIDVRFICDTNSTK